jgi:hypothetical protein
MGARHSAMDLDYTRTPPVPRRPSRVAKRMQLQHAPAAQVDRRRSAQRHARLARMRTEAPAYDWDEEGDNPKFGRSFESHPVERYAHGFREPGDSPSIWQHMRAARGADPGRHPQLRQSIVQGLPPAQRGPQRFRHWQ